MLGWHNNMNDISVNDMFPTRGNITLQNYVLLETQLAVIILDRVLCNPSGVYFNRAFQPHDLFKESRVLLINELLLKHLKHVWNNACLYNLDLVNQQVHTRLQKLSEDQFYLINM
ncbi:Hypothetical_protein [Hexamita inflata]|uniref:Hypothetical_protein n=1 Tax=Hexamita inflata TaxID=28002 RepID=A0AA86TDQ0_9EUKA|nr:Hypothetical protein HINF_LOCUS3449 [Hexamita inflata]